MACLSDSGLPGACGLNALSQAVLDDFRQRNEETCLAGSRNQAPSLGLMLVSQFFHLIEISADFSYKL